MSVQMVHLYVHITAITFLGHTLVAATLAINSKMMDTLVMVAHQSLYLLG